jgi:hypothetical protein
MPSSVYTKAPPAPGAGQSVSNFAVYDFGTGMCSRARFHVGPGEEDLVGYFAQTTHAADAVIVIRNTDLVHRTDRGLLNFSGAAPGPVQVLASVIRTSIDAVSGPSFALVRRLAGLIDDYTPFIDRGWFAESALTALLGDGTDIVEEVSADWEIDAPPAAPDMIARYAAGRVMSIRTDDFDAGLSPDELLALDPDFEHL